MADKKVIEKHLVTLFQRIKLGQTLPCPWFSAHHEAWLRKSKFKFESANQTTGNWMKTGSLGVIARETAP
jgi:hypothetical protein